MILTIAARELRSLFLSPLAWTILAVVQFILAWLFLGMVDYYIIEAQPRLATLHGAPGVAELIVAPLFSSAAIVLLLVTPLLTMRLVSEERRNRTLTLLLSAPISMSEIILGKYLGLLAFLLLMLTLTALMPLSLLSGGTLDFGLFASALLGLLLLTAAFTAAGLFMSTLTQQPTVAGISSFGLLLLLWIIDLSGNSGDEVGNVFSYLSLLRHHESLLKGVFNSSDIVYYLLFITTFLVLSIRCLDAERLQP
ncbi:ABC transporter permease [Solemya pervernicosa gill symbiont]|uniref:ABC transporter permease n=2 Tax=Gammaproteobacteria incertae sedis TaxID=118884 RepID=A0A1T2L084_9GAMM|nr:ABC transporter permease subunit [Candidatus Reidiella endopervernicosa]OOZ38498.1 ABC transporter permease [Solemya pervernicosa gill symbiont]QKQ25771.1 ABC transporter permease subunit [Candidatus Reidiella endopervernicosa]